MQFLRILFHLFINKRNKIDSNFTTLQVYTFSKRHFFIHIASNTSSWLQDCNFVLGMFLIINLSIAFSTFSLCLVLRLNWLNTSRSKYTVIGVPKDLKWYYLESDTTCTDLKLNAREFIDVYLFLMTGKLKTTITS